ncbi:hypothetical protein [Flavobacterium olei]|uniref:hypothetical protein n=1 Tax=Flavobacterium olei TaxID=1886782 RepID=UPI00321BCF21
MFTLKKYNSCFALLFFFVTFLAEAQIGIGTTTPNASSVLDVTSTTQGMLTPRMTTVQRNAIATPADGLIVYDTDLKGFYYYSTGTSTWIALVNSGTGRLNFKRIRSTDNLAVVLAAELAAGGGAKYVLNSNTLYEINGMIDLNFPIDLNNAYIQGLDPNEDMISRANGNIFEGANGGGIRSVTLRAIGGSVFNLNGAATQNLIFRDSIVFGSNSVGTISGFGLVFLSIIQYAGNSNGITYNNITQLLLSNCGWFSTNSGTYEKFTGNFTLIEKQGGFSQVDGSAIGFDVSTIGTINGDAVLESVVFTGTNTAGYVKGYASTNTYPGYNFSNSWNVRSAGIPTESDASAVGDFAMDYNVGFGLGVTFNNSNPSDIVKIGLTGAPNTVYSNLFRFYTDSPNRLRYAGKKKRIFQITGSISFQVNAAGTYIIFISKNGTPLSQYKIYGRGQVNGDIIVLPLNATTEMVTNDFIEISAQRFSGSTGTTGNIVVPNMVVTIK